MNLSKKFLSILLSLLFVAPLPWLTVGRARAQAPRVYLDPTPLILNQIGATGAIEVNLEGVSESAGFEFVISFDNKVIRVDEVLSAYANSLKAIKNEDGTVTFGAYTPCDKGVCPNILSGSPAVLATLTVAAVGEGTTGLEFASHTLYGVEMGANDMPVEIDATLVGGQVKVGGTPSDGETIIDLSAGGNRVTWPGDLGEFTSLSALESVAADCGGGGVIVRKKNGWWESAVHGYGGANFSLSVGTSYYVKVASSCSWTP